MHGWVTAVAQAAECRVCRLRPGAALPGIDRRHGWRNFWDDRATGLNSGSPTADQATAPFTNPVANFPDRARAYMHNGYFTDLTTVVHFYYTRNALPRCVDNTGVVGVTCWPAPKRPANLNTNQTGNLRLTSVEKKMRLSRSLAR